MNKTISKAMTKRVGARDLQRADGWCESAAKDINDLSLTSRSAERGMPQVEPPVTLRECDGFDGTR